MHATFQKRTVFRQDGRQALGEGLIGQAHGVIGPIHMPDSERRTIRQPNCRHGIEKAEELDRDRQTGKAIFHPTIGIADPG
ncbi:hypothetical protein HW03_07545 [Pseudomonas aeruginosa]|nr:hypothetical protein HW03_07545 [Pseudomonas aeruginosa]EOT15044.1 hypothetical protein CIA_03353 [Pseudomonas aeruginosa PA14]OFM81422.1 hypothetical protein HMPREF2670_08305 [Pseudomonas sp. HMSC072F09]OHO99645.1 hypothetical protein HMPREF2581_20420 [Pseudomonas sp. HMSC057H01]KRU81509.1 hypothetical protein AN452_13365 [Pseudomonas aeruginosa]